MENMETVLARMVDSLTGHDEMVFLDDVQLVWRRGWLISGVDEALHAVLG
jgi:hypothetical protein